MRAAVLGVVLALALAGSTHAAVPVKLSLRSIDSSSILERGALTVKVVARRKGRVRVSAGTLARARTLRICGPRTRVTVKAGRKRTRRLLRRRRSCRNPPPDAVVLGPPPGGAPAPRPAGFDTPEGCDFLDPAVCLQPWPNDYFTVADAGTPTGRRLDLQREAMPKNVAGKPIEPGDQRRPDRGADAEAARRRADGALRSRAARRRLGGRPGAPARHGQALPLRLLRDRLDRDVVQRRRQRPHDPQRPLALPDAHRSPPAGAAELPLPRPAHAQGVPQRARPHGTDRHRPALLRRQTARAASRASRAPARSTSRGTRARATTRSPRTPTRRPSNRRRTRIRTASRAASPGPRSRSPST